MANELRLFRPRMHSEDSLLQSSVQKMMDMQIEHNLVVHPQWDQQSYAFHRAIWIECSELIEHYGWKWWKKQERSISQVQLEIVDIWHFGLSMLIRDGVSAATITKQLLASDPREAGTDFIGSVEVLALTALQEDFKVVEFAGVLKALPMTHQNLYGLYLGKNLLNRFRQHNGYKTGSYRKVWNGREDNEHLYEIVNELDAWGDDVEQQITRQLEHRYHAAA